MGTISESAHAKDRAEIRFMQPPVDEPPAQTSEILITGRGLRCTPLRTVTTTL
jgi:hypothetical protein